MTSLKFSVVFLVEVEVEARFLVILEPCGQKFAWDVPAMVAELLQYSIASFYIQ